MARTVQLRTSPPRTAAPPAARHAPAGRTRRLLIAMLGALVLLGGLVNPGAAVPARAQAAPARPAAQAVPSQAVPAQAVPAQAVPTQAGPADPAAGDGSAGGVHAVDSGQLPHDLSPWGMFAGADIVVKAVMIGLAFASVATWTVLLVKQFELMVAVGRQKRLLAVVATAPSLSDAAAAAGARSLSADGWFQAAFDELRLSADALDDRDGVKERVASSFERIDAGKGRVIAKGTGLLATIGSTAPFVGLFGTVWGIMNAFIGISEAQTTNLAVVAPGIAEALLATALGLVAAIPAVVVYNHFARQTAAYRALVSDTSAAVLRLVSRDLSRGVVVKSPTAKITAIRE